LIRALCKSELTRVTRGSTYDNESNLAASFLTVITEKYEGTRLGEQELYAKLLEEAEGALWSREEMDKARWRGGPRENWPDMKRVVVAIDPAASNTQNSAETGIVVAGIGYDKRGYLMHDASGKYTPEGWAKMASDLFEDYQADRVIGEVNNGGDMVAAVMRNSSPDIPFRAVHASRGKAARAEPIAALYEQGRCTHLEYSEELEDQLCTWEPLGDEKSPDRLDALVWAMTELFGRRLVGIATPVVSSVTRRLPGSLAPRGVGRGYAGGFSFGGGARKPGLF
jgi:predicted phage terminase large subunit-like protein